MAQSKQNIFKYKYKFYYANLNLNPNLTMREHLDWDLYLSQLKKVPQWPNRSSGKSKTFYSKALIENPVPYII